MPETMLCRMNRMPAPGSRTHRETPVLPGSGPAPMTCRSSQCHEPVLTDKAVGAWYAKAPVDTGYHHSVAVSLTTSTVSRFGRPPAVVCTATIWVTDDQSWPL